MIVLLDPQRVDIFYYFINRVDLILRYSPLTQKKRLYLKYKYRGKSQKFKLNEFILDYYRTLEVAEKLLSLYKKYYSRKKGLCNHDPKELSDRMSNLKSCKHPTSFFYNMHPNSLTIIKELYN